MKLWLLLLMACVVAADEAERCYRMENVEHSEHCYREMAVQKRSCKNEWIIQCLHMHQVDAANKTMLLSNPSLREVRLVGSKKMVIFGNPILQTVSVHAKNALDVIIIDNPYLRQINVTGPVRTLLVKRNAVIESINGVADHVVFTPGVNFQRLFPRCTDTMFTARSFSDKCVAVIARRRRADSVVQSTQYNEFVTISYGVTMGVLLAVVWVLMFVYAAKLPSPPRRRALDANQFYLFELIFCEGISVSLQIVVFGAIFLTLIAPDTNSIVITCVLVGLLVPTWLVFALKVRSRRRAVLRNQVARVV